jgi:hypothetical protein
MGRTARVAIALMGVLAGASAAAAQNRPAATTRPPAAPTRAFAKLFAMPATTPRGDTGSRPLKALPQGTRCHLVVTAPDPRIDPRMSIAPSSSTRFFLREAPADRVCQ